MRRLRRSEGLRRLVRETRVAPADLVQPLFVVSGSGVDRPIPSLPGQRHVSADVAAAHRRRGAGRAASAACCSSACPTARTSRARRPGTTPARCRARSARSAAPAPGLPILTDVCLCQYTSHGACGVLHDGEVDNDATLPLLARVALSHARAGADAVAPSDMMDGRVAAIRSGARRRRPARRRRSSPTARSSPRPSTGRSAMRPARRPSPATARATSSTARTPARPCARRCSTPPRAPTR